MGNRIALKWEANKLPNGVWEVIERIELAYRTVVRGVTQEQAIKIASEHNKEA